MEVVGEPADPIGGVEPLMRRAQRVPGAVIDVEQHGVEASTGLPGVVARGRCGQGEEVPCTSRGVLYAAASLVVNVGLMVVHVSSRRPDAAA